MSPHVGITSDQLVEETTEYFRNYNLNGITGSVTIFGDYGLQPAVQVELIDKRNPSKNGIYLVEEVTTTFGVGGYRQQLKMVKELSPSMLLEQLFFGKYVRRKIQPDSHP